MSGLTRRSFLAASAATPALANATSLARVARVHVSE
jgi:hypothetical protein